MGQPHLSTQKELSGQNYRWCQGTLGKSCSANSLCLAGLWSLSLYLVTPNSPMVSPPTYVSAIFTSLFLLSLLISDFITSDMNYCRGFLRELFDSMIIPPKLTWLQEHKTVPVKVISASPPHTVPLWEDLRPLEHKRPPRTDCCQSHQSLLPYGFLPAPQASALQSEIQFPKGPPSCLFSRHILCFLHLEVTFSTSAWITLFQPLRLSHHLQRAFSEPLHLLS